jgi:hypothetical protein
MSNVLKWKHGRFTLYRASLFKRGPPLLMPYLLEASQSEGAKSHKKTDPMVCFFI